MKILMTTDTIGEVWTYTLELCRALAPHGVQIALASLGRLPSKDQRRQVAELSNVELHESNYRLCWMANSWADGASAGRWLLALERKFQPAVVHLNDLGQAGLPWRSPTLLATHSCVFSWWDAVKKQPPPKEQWRRYQIVVRNSVQRADQVVAPTQAMLAALLRHYGPAKASQVIFNGRDFPALVPAPQRAPTTIGSAVDPYIFTTGRRSDKAKNIAQLSMVSNQVQWPIYVAGKRDDPNGGRSEPESLNHLGVLSNRQMAYWLKRAAIYVAPAYYEPSGLDILEAARSGSALVLSNIASLRELWGDAAIYISPDDSDALCTALNRLIDDPVLRQQMADRAWRRAQLYRSYHMAQGYLDSYHSLLQPSANADSEHRVPAGVSL